MRLKQFLNYVYNRFEIKIEKGVNFIDEKKMEKWTKKRIYSAIIEGMGIKNWNAILTPRFNDILIAYLPLSNTFINDGFNESFENNIGTRIVDPIIVPKEVFNDIRMIIFLSTVLVSETKKDNLYDKFIFRIIYKYL